MRKAENYLLNFLTVVPIVWISICYLLYLLDYNPRISHRQTLDEYFLLFLHYFMYIGIPLWIVLMIYKGIAKHITVKVFVIHLLVFIVGAAILVMMMELNPRGWTGHYFD